MSLPPYKYEPLRGRCFRLLVLHPGSGDDKVSCDLVSASLDHCDDYEAISYVWGPPLPTETLLCDGCVVEVRENLYSALLHLRHFRTDRILWADALCINQNDLPERGEQVRLMRYIYSNADRTLIWLGPETPDVRDSFSFLKTAREFFPLEGAEGLLPANYRDKDQTFQDVNELVREFGWLDEAGLPGPLSYDWRPIANLLLRPWFSRKWIIQEVAIARRATAILGYQFLDWHTIQDVMVYLLGTGTMNLLAKKSGEDSRLVTVSSGRIVEKSFNSIFKLSIKCVFTLAGVAHLGSRLSSTLIPLARHSACTDPRDHIIALLGIATDVQEEDITPLDLINAAEVSQQRTFSTSGESKNSEFLGLLQPDYSCAPAQIFRNFAIWSIARCKSLEFFGMRLFNKSTASPSAEGALPSWVPDFGCQDDMYPVGTPSNHWATKQSRVSFSLSPDQNTLYLDGKLVDEIRIMGRLTMDTAFFEYTPSTKLQDTDIQEALLARVILEQEWLEECMQIAINEGDATSASRYQEFCETMKWHCGVEYELDLFMDTFGKLLGLILESDKPRDAGWAKEYSEVARELWLFLQRNSELSFSLTTKNRIGWMPRSAKIGDKICVFYGGPVPYVIRPTGNGRYRFIGDCYVNGIMFGESMDMEEIKTETFALI